MKAKLLIISLILIVCFAGIGIGLYCAWPAITGTITDSKYYTSEDLQDAYDKGFDDAFKNKDELTQQVDYYKELTDTYYISILDYQAKIKDYETLTENNKNKISILEQNKTELQSQVNNLTAIKNSNEETISNLQVEVSNLENQVKILENSESNKIEEIEKLNSQIISLNNFIVNLQNINKLNSDTITNLNVQIKNLNAKISDLTLQGQMLDSQILSLNNKISDLQKSVAYYESYIANLENGEQVVATFEFDGSVYNIQIVNKNSIVTVTTPTSTDYVIFNYWTVNGEQVDLSTYEITTNTKFVADVTYKYDVTFMNGDVVHNSQVVVENDCASLPENPLKEGFDFDGWSLNGVDIIDNISSTPVTQNVTYYAVFSKFYNVTFMVDNEEYDSQSVSAYNSASIPISPSKVGYVFNGWSIDGETIVDLSDITITQDTIFIAIFVDMADMIERIQTFLQGNVLKNTSTKVTTIDGFAVKDEEHHIYLNASSRAGDCVLDINLGKINNTITSTDDVIRIMFDKDLKSEDFSAYYSLNDIVNNDEIVSNVKVKMDELLGETGATINIWATSSLKEVMSDDNKTKKYEGRMNFLIEYNVDGASGYAYLDNAFLAESNEKITSDIFFDLFSYYNGGDAVSFSGTVEEGEDLVLTSSDVIQWIKRKV